MASSQALAAVGAALHPIHPQHARFSALVAAVGAVSLVVAIAAFWPEPREGRLADDLRPLDSWPGRLTWGQRVTRAVSVFLVALAVSAGRLGAEDGLSNIAPALVVGVAWPALLFVSAAGGPIWRWLDPWDGLARALGADGDDPARGDVRAAVVPALAVAWYLAVYVESAEPRAVGLALGVYSVLMVAGAVVVGRSAWLSRVEVFGLLFGWLARLPRGMLRSWDPPRGAELVLGALAGGLAFGLVRTSEVWGSLNVVEGATLYATLAMLGSAAVVALALWLLERWAARGGGRGSVTAAALPAVAAVALVVALARSRLFTSLQLLPALASDPFGAGWDLFGTRDLPILRPLDPLPLAGVQLAVLILGAVAGAIVLGRRVPRTGRRPAILALGLLVGLGVYVLSLAPGL